MKIFWTPQTAKGHSRPLRDTPPYHQMFFNFGDTTLAQNMKNIKSKFLIDKEDHIYIF